MDESDRVLLDRWRNHADADAFAEIVSRYSGMVFAVSRRIVMNDADAEEVAQECFLRLGRTGRLRRKTLAALLHTIATRSAINRRESNLRRRLRERAFAECHPDRVEPGPDDLTAHVDEVITALPESLRQPLVDRYLLGQTYVHIAERLGIDESTVRHRVRRALELTREQLANRSIRSSVGGLAAFFTAESARAVSPVLTHQLGLLAIAGQKGPGAVATGIGSVIMGKKVAVAVGVFVAIASSMVYVSRESSTPGNATLVTNVTPSTLPEPGIGSEEDLASSEDARDAAATKGSDGVDSAESPDGFGSNRRVRDVGLPSTLDELRQRAAAANGEDTWSDDAINSTDVARDNGAHYFLLASEWLGNEGAEEIGELFQRFEEGTATIAEIEAALAKYANVLAAIREGVALGNAMMPQPLHGPNEELPYLSRWRSIGRLLAMESHMLAESGSINASLDSLDTAIAFANDSSRGGTMIGGLVSYAMTNIAFDGARDLLGFGNLAPMEYQAVIQRMSDLEVQAPYARELQVYESDALDGWLVQQIRQGRSIGDTFGDAEWAQSLRGIPADDLEIYLDEFLQDRERIIEYSELPYYQMYPAEAESLIRRNPISEILFPSIMRIAEAEARNTARLRGVATMSAVEWYASDHGAYPETIDALVPAYLPEVPRDPFTGEAFRYFVDADGYTLYAADGDRVDNGGNPGDPGEEGSDLIIHTPESRLPQEK